MDFSKVGSASKKKTATDPFQIFEALPSLEDTPNDLWRGQSDALEGWHKERAKNDVLVTLNTGAGKTIVGLLIAQSLLNEELDNVVYVCSTIDLVHQTAAEAKRIGIPCTTRIDGQFNNDLFETDQAFCITTYAALFNGFSVFAKRYRPSAVVFDDAHVADGILRDSFTLRVKSNENPELFGELASLFKPHFDELGSPMVFKDSLDPSLASSSLAAPRGVISRKSQLASLFEKHRLGDSNKHKFQYAHIKDHIPTCAAVFSRGIFELSPPFLPSLALDVFRSPIRRVYLSATMESKTDFVRTFGREPEATIVPKNDAGNGERLILNGLNVTDGFGESFVKPLVRKQKAVVAVPSYFHANNWTSVGVPPERPEFTEKLHRFRSARSGGFILVSRVDGIDLPQDTCRIMVMEGLPSGATLLEKFQWEYLAMIQAHSVRIANRLAQLFGRINRGRNDYGAFLLEGPELNYWLKRKKNLALLPPLLRQQILVGQEVQEAMSIDSASKTQELLAAVLGRDEGWIDLYQREVKEADLDEEQIARVSEAEPTLIKAALAEAKFAAATWDGDFGYARRQLEGVADDVAQFDALLSGWHYVWLAAMYDHEGDFSAAETCYGIAHKRLNGRLLLPRKSNRASGAGSGVELTPFAASIEDIIEVTHGSKFETQISAIERDFGMIREGPPRPAEAGVRRLGELLGFESVRPDNDEGTGPDVAWVDRANANAIGFELKTDKTESDAYFKKEIGQGLDHLEWMRNTYKECDIIGLIYIGPALPADAAANPSRDMGICPRETLSDLADEVVALIRDLRQLPPVKRSEVLAAIAGDAKWELSELADRLWEYTFEI